VRPASVQVTDSPSPVPACGPVPSAEQLRWHALEVYGFIHFTVNTFTDLEWGEGTEAPGIFMPTDLDCRQWAHVFRDGGLRGMILTAKHHDGFCLWPSRHTRHSVRNSPWRDGQGDVVREAADACAEFGLRFGIYLSPWDRHEATYGDSRRYNAHYCRQLEELMTGYGELFEVWFDGACGEGPNGRQQEYDWQAYREIVRRHQSDAVIFGTDRPDVRWVGNENGYAQSVNWCPVRQGDLRPAEFATGHGDGDVWMPAECDVSIRPGWFYHAHEDEQVKRVAKLMDIYHASVGSNACLLLNVPPDRRGRIHEIDAMRLREFREERERVFRTDLARGRPACASNTRGGLAGFAPERAVDGDDATCWATDEGITAATLTIDLESGTRFDHVLLQEPISHGQRIEAFVVEALEDGTWKELVRGTTIGYKRILRTRLLQATRVRLRVLAARACPLLKRLGLFHGG